MNSEENNMIKTYDGFAGNEPNQTMANSPPQQDVIQNQNEENIQPKTLQPMIMIHDGFGENNSIPKVANSPPQQDVIQNQNEENIQPMILVQMIRTDDESEEDSQPVRQVYNKYMKAISNKAPQQDVTQNHNEENIQPMIRTDDEYRKNISIQTSDKPPQQDIEEKPIPENNQDNQEKTTSIILPDNIGKQSPKIPYNNNALIHSPEDPYVNTQMGAFTHYPIILHPENIYDSSTPSNDTGNAEFLMRWFKDNIIYNNKYGFRYWNGGIWDKCDDNELKRFVIYAMRSRDKFSKANPDYDVDDTFFKQSGNNSRIDDAIAILKAELYVKTELLDSAEHILCVRNGVIDFETQALRPHSDYKSQYLTKMIDVDYIPCYHDNIWAWFIDSITSGDHAKALYLQKAFGAAIIGNPKEQKVHILRGNGSNGKSTCLNAIRNTLTTEYVCEMPIKVLTGSDNQDANAASPAIAALEGKLIAIASEVGSDDILNEAKLKKLCGGGKISARKLRQNSHEFEPKFSIFIDTNCLPKVKNASSSEAFAVFRRIVIIPFNNTFDGNRDTSLGECLNTESAKTAILAWLVQGAFEYIADPHLIPTPEMEHALDMYKMTENTVAGFINDCICITNDPNDIISSADLYNYYCTYCEERGLNPVNKNTFSKCEDFEKYRYRTAKIRGYRGIRILDK